MKYLIIRILLTAVILAIKYNEDDFYSNTYYGKIGGVSLEELNKLEEEFVNKIEFTFWIDEELFSKYKNYLQLYKK